MTFHDGSPLDAQAVYDSYARTIVNKMTTWYILGRFVGEARRSMDEFKDELTAASDEEENKRKKR